MGIKALTVIADGSGVKEGRGTQYYEWRLETFKRKRRHRGRRKRRKRRRRSRKKFVRVVMPYVPEIDMIFEITATSSSVGELKAFENGHLPDITSAKIFYRFIADKLYDSENLVRKLRDAGIDVYTPARGGKLEPNRNLLGILLAGIMKGLGETSTCGVLSSQLTPRLNLGLYHTLRIGLGKAARQR